MEEEAPPGCLRQSSSDTHTPPCRLAPQEPTLPEHFGSPDTSRPPLGSIIVPPRMEVFVCTYIIGFSHVEVGSQHVASPWGEKRTMKMITPWQTGIKIFPLSSKTSAFDKSSEIFLYFSSPWVTAEGLTPVSESQVLFHLIPPYFCCYFALDYVRCI